MLPAGAPLSDWLAWLETLSPVEIDMGLERVEAVLQRLPVTRPEHVFIVAGTNGKGSTVAMSEALLRAAGCRVGAYTSPHINHYNERIAIDGQPVDDATIVAAFEAIERVRDSVPLTYFEYGTLAAFVAFSEAGLDAWVLEVGMGGRLDATNVIEPTGALITNVALDHCAWLGEDVETIAVEKAGVMRAGVPVIFGDPEVPRSIVACAEAIGADLRLPSRDYRFSVHDDGTWDWDGRTHRFGRLPAPGLVGGFQVGNAAAVLALLEAAGPAAALDEARLAATLPQVRLTGRSQRLTVDDREWFVDVAHNPAAAMKLASVLDAEPPRTTRAVIGMLDDKDVEGVVAPLDPYVDHWIAVTADSRRAIPDAELARRIANLTGRPCRIAASLDEALDELRQAGVDRDRILVTGSFYLVGPVLEKLGLYSRPSP
jgi:dihydrofolate synthase/folylpolyglutamate synthase